VLENKVEEALADPGIQPTPYMFAPHVIAEEDFLELYPLSSHDARAQSTLQESYRDFDPPLPGSLHESLRPQSPLVNLFLTGFDQYNLLPLGDQGEDVIMGYDQE
jgi:hypothetical protein